VLGDAPHLSQNRRRFRTGNKFHWRDYRQRLKRSGYCVFGCWPISASRLRRPTKGGLVEEVADPGKALDAAMALATKVAAQPPLSAP
jgi:hypothetical protein